VGPQAQAAAIGLARAGLPHLLIERTRDTADALCGGFLSWRSLERLAALGVEADQLNPARLTEARLFARGRVARARLPRPALAVSRRHLDTVLMERALGVGAAVERGVLAREIAGTTIRTADGVTIAADMLFLASGKHDVRGAARPADARGDDPTLGLRLRLASAPGLTRLLGAAVELHLFPGGYAGLALQEDGSANLCLAVHRSRLQAVGSAPALLAALGRELPALGDRLAYADFAAPIDAVANVPYGWRTDRAAPGQVRLGDQAACIPSLAGEGMGIALASGIGAAAAYVRGGPDALPGWQRSFARDVARPMRVAGVLRTVAESAAAPLLLPAARPALVRLLARLTRVPLPA
jgi:flavin-dependent dehydrogenase